MKYLPRVLKTFPESSIHLFQTEGFSYHLLREQKKLNDEITKYFEITFLMQQNSSTLPDDTTKITKKIFEVTIAGYDPTKPPPPILQARSYDLPTLKKKINLNTFEKLKPIQSNHPTKSSTLTFDQVINICL